jgi:alpha-glucoside transport system substrate-binding protein
VSYRPAKKFMATVAGMSALALVLTACGSSSTSSSTTSAAATSAAASSAEAGDASGSAAAPAGPASATSDWCDKAKALGDLNGKSVTVYSTIVAPEDAPYREAFKLFTECTGATATYDGSKEFEAQIGVRVNSGNPPDVAWFPQPGLLSQLVNTTGAVKPMTPEFEEWVKTYYPEDWLQYGVVNDIPFGIPGNADFKSLVWYSPKVFAEKGYTVPTTWEELWALTDKIAATGAKPWCIGIKSGEATGWQITDWLEEYVLRLYGPEVYDQWITHDVKFSDPPIADSLAQVGDVLKDPARVNGGFGDVQTIASTEFNDVKTPILTGDCTFTRQSAAFDSNYKDKTIGPDGDVNAFYLPPANDQFGKPVLGGGTIAAAFSDRPEVQAFQYFLASPEYANARAKLGSFISPNLGLQVDSVPSEVQKTALKTFQDPDATFRFDASDLMPAPVGSDAEWKQFTAWITGQDDATTLANIDAAWPAN